MSFVEVESGVELGLAGEQYLEARFVLKRPVGLAPAIGQRFLEPLVLGGLVEGAQRVLDTLHGAGRIVGVDVLGIGSHAPDERVGTDAPGLSLLRISNPLKLARSRGA